MDYSSLKQGKLSIVLVPDRELYVRDEIVFPLCELAERALKRFSDANVKELDDLDSLPPPFVDDVPEIHAKSKSLYHLSSHS